MSFPFWDEFLTVFGRSVGTRAWIASSIAVLTGARAEVLILLTSRDNENASKRDDKQRVSSL